MSDKNQFLSVVMIDGSFRENVYALDYFSRQDYPEDRYEVLWVEYYEKANEEARSLAAERSNIRLITLNREGEYHSSYCFNEGIRQSRGEIILIPDADQIVASDFLTRVDTAHRDYERLVVYGYRYDEPDAGVLQSHDLPELQEKCVMKNPYNYGGCLTVRKKWLLEIDGYEMHPVFGSGFHANGRDINVRLKNLGLAVMWHPQLRLYHPWHEHTLASDPVYKRQGVMISHRIEKMEVLPFVGMTQKRELPEKLQEIVCPPEPSEARRKIIFFLIRPFLWGVRKALWVLHFTEHRLLDLIHKA